MNQFSFFLAGVQLSAESTFFLPSIELRKKFALSTGQQDEENSPCSVQISDEDWQYFSSLGMEANSVTEFSLLSAFFSDALLPYERIIVHGVAVRWRDQAYLICANPGVGKSTQAKCLQKLRPGEFGIICGDRPVLEFCQSERSEAEPKNPSPVCHIENSKKSASAVAAHSVCNDVAMTKMNKIIVHPSPWNGKENWHGAEAAPLASVILLERGEENRLVSISEREAMLPMYTYFIHNAKTEENVKRVAELETRLLRAVPFWKLTTHEVPASTRLLLDAVFS